MTGAETLWGLVGLNSALFRNCLVGLTEEQARTRPNGSTNSVAFVAGHLVESRAWTVRYLGGICASPFDGVLEHATSIEQVTTIPSLAAIESAWDRVTEAIEARRGTMGSEDWSARSSQRFPGVAETRLGGFGFLVHHEAYHLGQLALLRRFFGHPAMSYRIGAGQERPG
ncbi:MAG: DinB family protein [Gemmatimonadetes bacterium]|nr:DinB family protein [Gemmatimonadota bacterium]